MVRAFIDSAESSPVDLVLALSVYKVQLDLCVEVTGGLPQPLILERNINGTETDSKFLLKNLISAILAFHRSRIGGPVTIGLVSFEQLLDGRLVFTEIAVLIQLGTPENVFFKHWQI